MKVSNAFQSSVESRRQIISQPHDGLGSLALLVATQIIPANLDGFTFCPRTRRCLFSSQPLEPDLFVVSIAGCERTFWALPDTEKVRDWMGEHAALFFEPGYYIGGWRKGSVFFLDVSTLVIGFAAAIQFGKRHSQETVYHPASDQVIEVNHPIFELPAAACAC